MRISRRISEGRLIIKKPGDGDADWQFGVFDSHILCVISDMADMPCSIICKRLVALMATEIFFPLSFPRAVISDRITLYKVLVLDGSGV